MTAKKNKFVGMQDFSRLFGDITRQQFKKRGFAESKIISEWGLIVGNSIAAFSTPTKIYFPMQSRSNGVLHVDVYDSCFATELLYKEPIVLEKLSTYFGYNAVTRIKIIQKIKFIDYEPDEEEKEIELTAEQQTLLEGKLQKIDDADIHDILYKIGKSVITNNNI
jgi:hypothetical protein